MRAAVIHEHGGPGSIKYEANFPDPKPAAGEVIVKVHAATLNYHDLCSDSRRCRPPRRDGRVGRVKPEKARGMPPLTLPIACCSLA